MLPFVAAREFMMYDANVKGSETMNANSKQEGGSHYKNQAIQAWDYIAVNNIGYFEGNIIKYVSRWRKKGGLEDLRKARHYLDKLIELEISK
jgi:hypothetical protein